MFKKENRQTKYNLGEQTSQQNEIKIKAENKMHNETITTLIASVP